MGKTCSIIYGALPYDVRYEEARKFREGETDIVVATDAIGMGLNMPVRRIVFLQTDKFDGYERRELYPAEIQQIAGRAGRYGIFDEGYVNTLYDAPLIEEALRMELPQDTEAVVAFPGGAAPDQCAALRDPRPVGGDGGEPRLPQEPQRERDHAGEASRGDLRRQVPDLPLRDDGL